MQSSSKAERERKRRFKAAFPSIIMENLRSLANKMGELEALTRKNLEFQQCSLMCFTETWLQEIISRLQHLSAWISDNKGGQKYEEERKKQRSCRFCKPGHATVKHCFCSPDIELLAVSLCPHYLPRVYQYYCRNSLHLSISWSQRCMTSSARLLLSCTF